MKISRETAPLMNDGRTSKEVMDALYDDQDRFTQMIVDTSAVIAIIKAEAEARTHLR